MKETEKIDTPEHDKVVIEQNVQKQVTLLGSQRKIKGLTMFEFDPIKLTLEPANYKDVQAELNGKTTLIRHKLMMKEGCVYIQALNKRNAYKKIAKRYKNFKINNNGKH